MRAPLVAIVAVMALGDPAPGREHGNWTRGLEADGKSVIWTLPDSGGRGAQLVFHCRGRNFFELLTKDFLREMADVEDGKIKVVFISPTHERLAVDGVALGDEHGVTFKEGQVTNWLRWREHDQNVVTMTVALSNNGKREFYEFQNRATADDDVDLECKLPKK